jgi:hypothetical protein
VADDFATSVANNPLLKAIGKIASFDSYGKKSSGPKASTTSTNFAGYAKDPGSYTPTAAKPKKAATMSKKAKAPKMPAAKPVKAKAVKVKPGYPAPKKKK